MDRRPLPGTIRRRKRKRAPSRQQISFFKVALAVMVLLTGLAWTIGLLWFSLRMNLEDKHHKMEESNGEEPPPRYFNLWPTDASAADLEAIMVECPDCPTPLAVAKTDLEAPERVLIVRPPGQFGESLSEFVESFLEGSGMEVVSSTVPMSSSFPEQEDYDILIHIVTLPLLLEAFDVLLMAAEPTKALLTADDVLAVVQHLIKWHCRVASHARQTRSVVLTLDPTLSFPLKSERQLQVLYNQTNIPIPRDEFAKKTMDHIDAGTAFWKTLLGKGKALRSSGESSLPERVDKLIQQAMKDERCPESFPSQSSSWFAMSSPLETLLESLWETSVSDQVMDEN